MTIQRAVVRVTLAFTACFLMLVSSVQATILPDSSPLSNAIAERLVVSFDGKGTATVSAEFSVHNYGKEEQKELRLSVPGSNVRVLRTILWYGVERTVKCDTKGGSSDCIENYQPYTTTDYKYAIVDPTVAKEGDVTTITVPYEVPLPSLKTTTVYLTYKAEGFVTEKAGGLWDYSFRSPILGVPVDTLSVAVYVDSSMYGAGEDHGVVQSSDAGSQLGQELATVSSTGIADTGFNLSSSFSRTIDNSSTAVVRRTNNLDPNESFTVSGSYARSWWRLNLPMLASLLGGVALLILLIVFGERYAARRLASSASNKSNKENV